MSTHHGLSQWRQICAGGGILALLAQALLPEGHVAESLALAAFILLAFAVAGGWLEFARGIRRTPTEPEVGRSQISWQWLLVTGVVALLAGVAMQAWFRPGTAIGLGDTVLPSGFAWVERLFQPWVWTGFNMGEPSQLPLELPRAAVFGLAHAWGGDASLAQRLWYTLLYVGAALGAVALIAALRLGPIAGLIGAAVYVLNPAVVSEANINPVFLAALCPLVALPAAVIAAGTGRLSTRWSAVIIASAAPLIGYVFFNPPLVGMILAAFVGSPLLVAWVYGRAAAGRSFRALLLATPLLLAVSAYWIGPALIHLSGFSGSQLASITSWSWTEGRASIRNAFWLNTVWGWRFTEFYPFASIYDALPLSILRFVLPALAFGALALTADSQPVTQSPSRHSSLRLSIVAATVALFFILLSNGTNAPGNIVFVPLYNLPLGWLLREPGRFLLLVSATYAVLVAVLVEAGLQHGSWLANVRSRRLKVPSWQLASVPIAFGTAVLLGFPVYTGAEIPDSKPGLPTGHVTMPSYWPQMASFVDGLPSNGDLLVLPPDDFYGMPYSWGYYGVDSFIPDLFRRRVLVPNPQGYSYVPTSPQLTRAVNLIAQAILQHDWRQVSDLARTLNTPLILVRRDVLSPYQGRAIVQPKALADALALAPNVVLIHRVGLLDLFELDQGAAGPYVHQNFMTVDSATPDLRILSLLPPNEALVTHGVQPELPSIIEAPPVPSWPIVGNALIWQPTVPPNASYRIAELESQTTVAIDRPGQFSSGGSNAQITFTPNLTTSPINVSITGRTAITNGDFAAGPWGSLKDCRQFSGAGLHRSFSATVVDDGPNGTRVMRLAATAASACVNQSIDWRGGPLVLSVMVNRLEGGAPRLCLWEFGPERCAPLPAILEARGWSTFRGAVTPDAGTTALALYLYADGSQPAGQTVDEYSAIQVIEVQALPTFDLIAEPSSPLKSPTELVVTHETFSDAWQGSTGTHVLVDGMLNGWLITTSSPSFSLQYRPAAAFRNAQVLSLVTVLLVAVWLIGVEGRRWWSHHGLVGLRRRFTNIRRGTTRP
jgi:arabinofuranan 3-O-arabinosyltransferase